MIFFGTKAKIVPGDIVSGMPCPNCQHTEFRSFGLQKYFHLYWIPTFPTGRTVGLECTNCKHALVDADMPMQVEGQVREKVFAGRSSIPMFTGSILIAVLVGFLWNAVQQDNAEEAAWFAEPQVGDYWVVDYSRIGDGEIDAEYPYGLMRVVELDGEMAYFEVSTTVYNKPMGVQSDIREGLAADASYYDEEIVSLDAVQMQELRDTRAIYSIERD